MPDNHATFESDTPRTAAVHAEATQPGPGSFAVYGITSSPDDPSIYGEHGGNGTGVFGLGGPFGGIGVRGQSIEPGGTGVFGEGSVGVHGFSETGATIGVYGEGDITGVEGFSSLGHAVLGTSGDGIGVFGTSGATGVFGQCFNATGTGVYGFSNGGTGVFAETVQTGVGLTARNDTNQTVAYLATSFGAATFVGDVAVFGNLSKTGGGFRIDHPIRPAEQYLSHSFVESSERKNIYDGVATLDDQGETTVTLPGWFTALNTDFCYQLTALGHAAPGLHIATEISDNRFTIAGGHGGSKVSWQVTGIRQDPWAQVHPLVVEDDKTTEEQGYYLHPELYDAAETLSITRLRHGDLPARPRQRHETTGTHPGRRVK